MKRIVSGFAVFALILCPLLTGADDPAGMRGITGVTVAIEDIPSGGARIGLSKEDIRTDVELKLRLAGMRVLTGEESKMSAALSVNVNITDDAGAANVSVELYQVARLFREPNAFLPLVATWESNGRVMSNPTSSHVRDSIKDMVDVFLNLWLKANPKIR
jgi:hypothetical protein